MRKNHHGKKDRLVKRVFALCLALAVICTCLVPVFATEDLSDLQVEKELPGTSEEEAAGFGDDFPAVDDGEPREVYDDSEAAGFGEEEASRPVEGGEDNLDGGPSVKETEWGTVIEYGPSSSTGTDPEPETQWSGEDDVVEKPDDKVVVSGDEIKKLQDMVVYRFWLRELNTLDLQDITAQAQINNMTESEYLARNGEVLWNLYFIQAVPRAETIADYSSYIENPSSNRDPKGELRQFDYWYTLDEFGNRVRLNLTDPTSNILDDKTTTVNVYAAWKDGTVGSDEEEDVDHEDLVDKNPVPVDLTAKASASYEDEDGNTKSVNLPVEVKNLPSAADHLNVIHMGDDDMESFYESHEDSLGEMMPILGLKISPKNAKGEKVQLAEGEKATVTVSDLNKLPEIAAMEGEGALTADALKVLHQKDDNTVEKLDVVSYENGTLTFETSSFSPFVIALTGGYDVETLDTKASSSNVTVMVHATKKIQASGSGGSWSITKGNDKISLTSDTVWENERSYAVAYITGLTTGSAEIKYTRRNQSIYYTINVTDTRAAIYFLSSPDGYPASNEEKYWSPTTDQSALSASIDVSNATWNNNKNIFTNVGSHILLWPDKETSGGYWILTSEDTSPMVDGKTAFKYVLDSIWENYKKKIANDLGINVNTLGKDDISQIKLSAYKISRDNSNTDGQFFHIDCMIDVVSKANFTAKFRVKYPGNEEYEVVDTKNYKHDSKVDNTDIVDKNSAGTVSVPLTMVEDGVTYQLTGWYPENAGGEPYDPDNKKSLKDSWGEGYTPSKAELADGTVNFYAHYKKATSNVTITKQVTGLLGDTNKEFAFNVSIKQNGADCTGVTANKNGAAVSLNDGFTLKHGETVTLENVPIGATITVTEVTPGEHYTVSATGHNGGQNGSGKVTFTYVAAANTATASDADEADLMLLSMDEDTAVGADGDAVAYDDGTTVDKNQIIVTNHCGLLPDTGVLLDTLPYIVILAVVVGGGILLMLRKRRKEDD